MSCEVVSQVDMLWEHLLGPEQPLSCSDLSTSMRGGAVGAQTPPARSGFGTELFTPWPGLAWPGSPGGPRRGSWARHDRRSGDLGSVSGEQQDARQESAEAIRSWTAGHGLETGGRGFYF